MPAMTSCALTPAQEKAWSMTRAALSWNCPGFIHLFYTMCDNAGSKNVALFTTEVPIAATDGINLLLNPETFFKYTNNERVFICAHEIMHCVLDHCGMAQRFARSGKIAYQDGTSLPFDQATFNVATDLVINDMLVESKVGNYNKDWFHDKAKAVFTDSAIDAYRKIYKKKAGGFPGGDQKGFDEHLAPGTSQGKSAHEAMAGRDEAEWSTNIAAAAKAEEMADANERRKGNKAAGLERIFGELLEPKVSWREHIQGLMARKLGSGSWNWQAPDDELIIRDIFAPSRSGFGAGTVVVGADTSGSIGDKELDMFFAEMAGILEDVKPQQLFVMWCDAKVQRVDECDDAGDLRVIRCKGAPGGGGTSFVPVFDEIDRLGLKPEALVYLTDGMGTFPHSPPNYPVIWGNIYSGSRYPFGDVVDVPKQVA